MEIQAYYGLVFKRVRTLRQNLSYHSDQTQRTQTIQ